MGITDFFKKKSSSQGDDAPSKEDQKKEEIKNMLSGVDTSQMSTMQKMAFKMFQKMPPGKQQEVLRQAMNPQNVQKNKGQILRQIDQMVKNGQIDKGQAEAIKSQMGLR